MLPPFPPTSLKRQLIKPHVIFTWGCPKAVVPCLGFVDKKPLRGAKAERGVAWETGHSDEDLVPLRWGQLWREALV